MGALARNVYGSIEEDVWRRITANGLYYNIADFSLWDYVGGAEDFGRAAAVDRRSGDPLSRRSGAYAAGGALRGQLGFTLEPASAAPIDRLRSLLGSVPAARLFDESLKLFLTGHGERSLEVLRQRCCSERLFPR